MKILHITPSFLPRPGGIGRYVYNLSEYLTSLGHEIEIAATDVPGNYKDKSMINSIIHANPKKIKYESYSVTLYPCLSEPLGNPIGFKLKELSKQIDTADIIHLHSAYYLFTFISVIILRIKKNKEYIITQHGRLIYNNSNIKQSIVKVYEKIIVRYILLKANKIVALSESDKNQLLNIAPVNDKIIVIPNGIDTFRFVRPNIEKINQFIYKYNIQNKKIILYLGVITAGKGVFDLLDAFYKLNHKDTILLIVGDGRDYEYARKIVNKFDLNDRVIFTGKLSYDDVLVPYSVANVYVLPSYSEGLPTTIIEACAMKIPVIATSIPSILEYFSQLVYLVEPGNIDQLKQMIHKVLSSPPDDIKLDEISNIIRCKFDLNNSFEKYNEIYGNL